MSTLEISNYAGNDSAGFGSLSSAEAHTMKYASIAGLESESFLPLAWLRKLFSVLQWLLREMGLVKI